MINFNFNVSKTFQTVTPESAEEGDFSEQDFIYEDRDLGLKYLLDEIKDLGYYELQANGAHITLYGADADVDYTDASETTYALHITGPTRAVRRLVLLLQKR